MTSLRQLSPGIDYSIWPQLKFNRARQLASELDSRIGVWSGSVPRGLTAVIAEDRLSVAFCARLPYPAPVYEWSLILADVLHNYRSALDALAWEMAHLDGGAPSPKNARRIYFPITTSREEWLKQARGPLASIPEDILERLHSVQPYMSLPIEEGIFIHLHELDIADKHKGLIRTAVGARDKSRYSYFVGLEHDAPLFEHIVGDPWTWLAQDGAVADGDALFEIRCDAPIVAASSPMRLPVAISVENRGKQHDVMNLLTLIDQQVSLTFELVETGALASMPGAVPLPVEFK